MVYMYHDTKEHVLNDKTNLLEDLRLRAKARRDEIFNDPNSTAKERKFAEDVVTVTQIEESYNSLSMGTVFAMFKYLGYEFPGEKHIIPLYVQMYDKIIEQANQRYTLVDPEWFKERQKGRQQMASNKTAES